jgi:hypothetical protein
MVGNPRKGSLKKNSAPRIFFRPMGETNNIFNGIGTIQLRVTYSSPDVAYIAVARP